MTFKREWDVKTENITVPPTANRFGCVRGFSSVYPIERRRGTSTDTGAGMIESWVPSLGTAFNRTLGQQQFVCVHVGLHDGTRDRNGGLQHGIVQQGCGLLVVVQWQEKGEQCTQH